MTETFTFADIAKDAIKEYNIPGNEQILNTISTYVRRYVNKKYGKGTKITKELKEKLETWEELGGYFKGQADSNWKGKKYYEEISKQMKSENEKWVLEQINSENDDPIIKEINDDMTSMKNFLMDKIMFQVYLNSDKDDSYKEDYKALIQNNFDLQLLKFAKKCFFNKYFDEEIFSKDFIHYYNRYEDSFNVTFTPEMAEALEALNGDDNFNKYLKD